MTAMGKARRLSSRRVYDGKVLALDVDEVEEPGGVHAVREVVRHRGSVAALPVRADGRIVLVRQYRYAVDAEVWELPAGRLDPGETPETGARRELEEEVGLRPEHVRILGRTRHWLRYEVPEKWIRRDWRGTYKGQKQIWYLLRLLGRDCDVRLRASSKPEFDAWRWSDYWMPMDTVIEFKRGVYQQALEELAPYLKRRPRGGAPGRRSERVKPAGAAEPG